MQEKPFPYVKFKTVKTFRTHEDPNGKEVATDWFLNVSGTHNQTASLLNFIKQGHRVIGCGNLEKSKYSEVRNYVASLTGEGLDRRLYEDAPRKALAEKVENERKK